MRAYSRSLAAVLIVAGGSFVLSACDMDQKTYLSQNRLQVEQSRYDAAVPVEAVDEAFYQPWRGNIKAAAAAGYI